MTKLKVTTVGSSLGIILSKDLLSKLRLQKGDMLYAIETPNGIELTPFNPEFAEQVKIAEQIMHSDRDVLKKLAE